MLVPIQQGDIPRKSLSKAWVDLAGSNTVVRTEKNRQVYVWLSGNGAEERRLVLDGMTG